jgi:hypothetical protein
MNFLKKNAALVVLILGLGGFLLYAWKTDFSFVKYFQKPYTPGQQEPPRPLNAQSQPYIPGTNPQPKTGEGEWRRSFEEEREK